MRLLCFKSFRTDELGPNVSQASHRNDHRGPPSTATIDGMLGSRNGETLEPGMNGGDLFGGPFILTNAPKKKALIDIVWRVISPTFQH